MKPKSPEQIKARVLSRGNSGKPGRREPIALNPNGAVMNVMAQVLQSDAVKIAIGSYLEGRDLKGTWNLRITGAELIPVK
jgi:hypothetical protein